MRKLKLRARTLAALNWDVARLRQAVRDERHERILPLDEQKLLMTRFANRGSHTRCGVHLPRLSRR